MDPTTQNEEDTGGIDRINSLSNSILCHILSFLPTKTCVATSLVCRRWRNLWEHVKVLNLCDDAFKAYGNLDLFERFAIFVNGVLALRKCREIQKLCLKCEYSLVDMLSSISITTWVRAAIGPQLEELRLDLYPMDGPEFVVPRTLFTCTNLVSLYLCGPINIHNLSLVQLPSLKVLQLNIVSVDSIQALLYGCPILETLDLSFSTTSFPMLRFPPSLKRLNFVVYDKSGTYLEFDTPCLNYLRIGQSFAPFKCSYCHLHKVVEANLDVYVAYEYMFRKLLHALSGVKHLVLGCSTTKNMIRAPTLDIPKFRYLHELELVLPHFNMSFVVKILEKCHMLRLLTIENNNEPSKWGKPPRAPIFHHVLHLTFIHYKGYQGFTDELEFLAYVLREGIVLERMIISTDRFLDIQQKNKVLKNLLALPRCSSMCEIKFDCATSP
ncbi:F-box/FBD/LRR-repeat protein At5g53840-like [Lotus japonicus]|uniref:F-box/FBD/LRR-repeat protein At5g53840-like n=1 Tax=Lotus japonicus TaxID=34305 RepID=UPI00258B715A|nr:F-box/FBD/LRR-repeat protein At5g53840-like [Lotus japonicus]